MRYLALAALLPLCGCSFIDRIDKAIEKVDKIATATELKTADINHALETVTDGLKLLGERGEKWIGAVTAVKDAVASADLDKDQKVSGLDEWKALLIALATAVSTFFAAGKRAEAVVRPVKEKADESLDKIHDLKRDIYPKIEEARASVVLQPGATATVRPG